MTEYEYVKELYALAIDDKNIWCKCPFIKTNYIHQFKNNAQSLLNRDEELNIEEDIDCGCNKYVVVNVGNYTERITLQQNKKKTSYIRNKKSRNKFKLLYKLELEGKRSPPTIDKPTPQKLFA